MEKIEIEDLETPKEPQNPRPVKGRRETSRYEKEQKKARDFNGKKQDCDE